MWSYLRMWARMFDFKGESKVGEFLWAILFHAVVFFALIYFLGMYVQEPEIYLFCMMGFFAISIIPILSLVIRRLNDLKRSKANLLWLLVPGIGALVLLFLLFSQSRSDRDREFDRYHW